MASVNYTAVGSSIRHRRRASSESSPSKEPSTSSQSKEPSCVEEEEISEVGDSKFLLGPGEKVSPGRPFSQPYESLHAQLYKIVLLGERHVGKTSLVRRIVERSFRPYEARTIGVDFSVRFVGEKNIKVQFWDPAGRDSMSIAIRRNFNTADAIILVYDVTSVFSFRKLNDMWKILERFRHPETRVFIVGTKSDLEERRIVPFWKAEEFSKKIKVPLFEVSALTGEGVEETFLNIVRELLTRRPINAVRDSMEISGIRSRRKIWEMCFCCHCCL